MVQIDCRFTQGTGSDVNSLPLNKKGQLPWWGWGVLGASVGSLVDRFPRSLSPSKLDEGGEISKTKEKQKMKTFNFQINKK